MRKLLALLILEPQVSLAAFMAMLFIALVVYRAYTLGYDQGRNDGFHAGWREAMEAKELPEQPTEDDLAMNIAIDFDGTFDRDTGAWEAVITVLLERGHQVFMVTSRSDEDKELVRQWAECSGISRGCVICTSGAAKRWFCEQRGLRIDVWIDDDPACIENGK